MLDWPQVYAFAEEKLCTAMEELMKEMKGNYVKISSAEGKHNCGV